MTTAVKRQKAFKPIKGKGWCGPTAIAAITGLNRDRVRRHVASLRGHNNHGAVKGVHDWELCSTLRALAAKEVFAAPVHGLTLKQWRESPVVEAKFANGQKAIVAVTGHYIAMAKSLALDTSHDNEPHHYLSSPYLRRKVEKVFWVM